MGERNIEQSISEYFAETVNAISLLYRNNYLGQTMILMFSTIDAFGLLNAPKNQKKASAETFRSWVNKYMIRDPRIEYSATDLWASRCATLHTYTTSSNLSNSGRAREILFYSGDPLGPKAGEFSEFADGLSGKVYITANIENTIDVFCSGLKVFARDLDKKCKAYDSCRKRLGQIIHGHSWSISH